MLGHVCAGTGETGGVIFGCQVKRQGTRVGGDQRHVTRATRVPGHVTMLVHSTLQHSLLASG